MRALLRPGVALLVTGALAVFILAAAGVALAEAGGQGPEPSRAGMRSDVAGAPLPCPPEPEACMALTVKSGGSCVDAACTISTGEKFTLAVEIEVAPADGYKAAQTWIDFGSQLIYNSAAAAADEIVWPDCADLVALRSLEEQGTAVLHGCITGLTNPPPSTHTGNLVELSFTCSSSPSSTEVRLVPLGVAPAGTSGTVLVNPSSVRVVPDIRNLTVHCAAPTATPTGTLPATPVGSATPMPTGGATAPPPGTPAGTPAATPTGGTTATPTFTPIGTPGATPVHGATATPATPAATPAATVGSTPTPTSAVTLVGDANCDGNIDPIDAAFILQWSARLLAALPCPANADASGNGGVDPLDATLILQFSSGLIGMLPPVPA